MNASLDRIALPAGTLLFAEGDSGACAYLIDSGAIEIYLAREGREVTLAIRGPGELVGEMAIIDSLPRSASARITADCELVVVTAEQIAYRASRSDPILRMCLGVVIAKYRETIAMIDTTDRPPISRADPSLSPDGFAAAMGTLSLESELRRALREGEFELFFQPVVRLATQRLAGLEALLRWRHPTRGLIPPNDFIPVAEACGLVADVTDWCLDEVGRALPPLMAAALRNVGAVEPLFMSVNISDDDLSRASFVDSVAAMLDKSGIAGASIKLEVTESVLMSDPAKAVAALEACRRLGLTIAIDDFGTGYSSLSYLSTLPINTIKIDRSFVRSMIETPASRKIIHMILRLADELDIPVVAEGVESAPEARMLAEMGCAFGQGYLFGKPVSFDQTLALTRAWRAPRESPLPEAAPARSRALG